jgi:hypothetical protein
MISVVIDDIVEEMVQASKAAQKTEGEARVKLA